MTRKRRNPSDSQVGLPTPAEVIRSKEISIVNQIQEQLEAAMRSDGITRERLASALGLTPAMVAHLLESPDTGLHDLASVAAVLDLSFRITSHRSGTPGGGS